MLLTMRFTGILILSGMATLLIAEEPATQTFQSSADLAAMMAKAKAERKPDQPNFVQQMLLLPPYKANLEVRVAGKNTDPNIHEGEAELVVVVDGAAMLTIGGKLKDERRTKANNRSGSAVEGGVTRRIAKGDYILIPEDTAHAFTKVEGSLTIMSLHVPRNSAGK
jgi:mannose-6-phosphate isomerase-like protein (cupin superfamily)